MRVYHPGIVGAATLGLALAGITSPELMGQAADSTTPALAQAITDLPTAGTIRVTSGGSRLTGRLDAKSPDSLTLSDNTGPRTLPLAHIDSLWVRGRNGHQALLAGAGFGALMFGILQLGGRSSEDPGLNTQLGLAIFAGALAAGAALDAVDDPWVRRYPVER